MNTNERENSVILTVITGFSIFTMLFGAGNFMVPPKLGILAGQKSLLASAGFIITAVVLPIIGLVGSFLFEGDYRAFFFRIGKLPGSLLIALCMFISGPGLVLPRIVNICFEMIHPFIPSMTLLVFAVLMAIVTFLLAYRPTKLIDTLGYLITPVKLSLIVILIIMGLAFGDSMIQTDISDIDLVGKSMLFGYETLDLLAIIFLGSAILDIFKKSFEPEIAGDMKRMIKRGVISSLIGGFVLVPVYISMTFLGAYYGAGLENLNHAQVLSGISFRIMGSSGGFFAAIALIVACLATMIALSTIVGEYIQKEIMRDRVGFIPSLIFILVSTIIISLFGLSKLMIFSRDLGFVLYPVIITLTLCNVAYKLFGFKLVKLPVLVVFLMTIFFQFEGIDHCRKLVSKRESVERIE